MSNYVARGNLSVARELADFVDNQLLDGSGITADSFWDGFDAAAHRLAPRIRVGHAWINSWQLRDLLSPLAGAGISGVGDQGGQLSLEFCSLPQTITTRIFGDKA